MDIEYSIRKLLNEEGYEDFSISNINNIILEGKRIIRNDVIKKLHNELNISIVECEIKY